jgi:glycine/serine hydroxymethyltransferase
MYANKNTVPHEPCSPFYPSGVRVGTPLVTTRGMKVTEMKQIAHWISQVVQLVQDETLPVDKKERAAFIEAFKLRADKDTKLKAIRKEVVEMASGFPLFTWK